MIMIKKFIFVVISLFIVACADISTETSIAGNTDTNVVPMASATLTATVTMTFTPTSTPTPTYTPSPTPTITPTLTPTMTFTPTPTATPVGGGGRIIIQMPRTLYDPTAGSSAIELFEVGSDGKDLQPLTTGFNRYIRQAVPSLDYRYLLLVSNTTWPPNLREEPRLDILDLNIGSIRTIAFLPNGPSSASVYWLADNRFIYLSQGGGETIGAFIASTSVEGSRRLSPPGHNVVKMYLVPSDTAKIYYHRGTRTVDAEGSTTSIHVTGMSWAAIDEPINDLSWGNITDHYFHAWDLQFNDQVFRISTNYHLHEIFPRGEVLISVSHNGLPPELQHGWESQFLLPSIEALSVLETPPNEISEPLVDFRCSSFTSDGSKIITNGVYEPYTENGRTLGQCTGYITKIISPSGDTSATINNYRVGHSYFYYSGRAEQFIMLVDENDGVALYNLTTDTLIPLPAIPALVGKSFYFSPDGKTVLVSDEASLIYDESMNALVLNPNPFMPILVNIENQQTNILLPQFIDNQQHIRVVAWIP